MLSEYSSFSEGYCAALGSGIESFINLSVEMATGRGDRRGIGYSYLGKQMDESCVNPDPTILMDLSTVFMLGRE
jgi:hypothetical protein